MKKKLWFILPILAGLFLIIVAAILIETNLFWYNCASPRHKEFKLVDHAGYACWSADGKALFYKKGTWTLFSGRQVRFYRYDVVTGKRRVYKIQNTGFMRGVSPDQKSVLLDIEPVLYTATLEGTHTQKTYSSPSTYYRPCCAHWLSNGKIVFVSDGIYIVNPDGTGLKKVVSKITPKIVEWDMDAFLYAASDGSGFLYAGSDGYYHFYDLAKSEDRPVPALGRISWRRGVTFVYLSRRQVIYFAYTYGDKPGNFNEVLRNGNVKAINLRTLKTRNYHLPKIRPGMAIAPDLTRYWFAYPADEWSPAELYVVDIPTKVVWELRRP